MTENTQRLIDVLTTSLEKWIDLAPEYVQSLVHRYATYQIWINSIGSFSWLFFVIVWIIGCYKIAKTRYPDDYVTISFLCVVLIVIWIIFLSFSIGGLLEVIYTPEISLLNSLKF